MAKGKSVPPVVVRPTPGLTPEETRNIRARAWAFVFDCHEKKKATRPGGPDDAEESKNDRTDTASIYE